MKKVIVIGAGIAGLASALRLRAKGYDVSVFESNSYAGGKLHALESKGYRFDYGPSLFTMPHFVNELFELHNEDPKSRFNYSQKDIICNYFWDDGTRFSAPADRAVFVQEAAEVFSEPKSHLNKYLADSKKKYDLTAGLFLEKSLHKSSTYLSTTALKSVLQSGGLSLTKTLNEVNQKHFDHPKLVQLFNRYATYNGSDPYVTPGIMSLIPHLEMQFGTFYPKGGMHEISQSLYRLAVDKGVAFHFNATVDEVLHEKGQVKGIVSGEETYFAEMVVCNMDVFSAYQSILKDVKPPAKVLKQERSSSALIFYWGVKKSFPELDLHNIFFSNDYKEEFKTIFQKNSIVEDPTVYINITSKEDPEHAPKNAENWFVMINTPSNQGQDWDTLKKEAKRNVLRKLSYALKTDIETLIETEITLDPIRIEADTHSHQGSLYGTSSNSKFAAFLRHPNFSSSIKNLYFCGGSAHPGGGIPLCLLSAKIVSDLIPAA
ncbi:MAG: 1-hydroxycarotenoid 3,4-desaturase CrtD [Bacteroidota bacterium]